MDSKDVQLIRNIINREDSKEFIDNLIDFYCAQSSENCQHLIDLISVVVNHQIRYYSYQIKNYRQAANWLIAGKCMDKNDKYSYFASMVPVMKTMYPKGLANNESYDRTKYFEEFINLLRDPEVFSLDNEEDTEWARSFDYLQYLTLIYTKYVEEK